MVCAKKFRNCVLLKLGLRYAEKTVASFSGHDVFTITAGKAHIVRLTKCFDIWKNDW